MSHKRYAIGLSLLMLGAVVYQACACGDYVCLTGEFANRTFANPATRPSNVVGPLYTFDRVRAAALSHDHRSIWTVEGDKGNVQQYRLADGAQIMPDIQGENAVISPDGRWILTTVENTTMLWDAKYPSFPKKHQLATFPARLMGFSPDSSNAWIVIGRNRLSLFKTETGELINDVRGHRDIINSVALSPDNKLVLSGSGRVHETAPKLTWGAGVLDNTARKWEVASGKMIDVKEFGERNPVLSVAFNTASKPFANRMPIFGTDGPMLDLPTTTVTTTRDGQYALAVGSTGRAVIYALPR